MIFDAGTELHGADGPFLWGPAASANNRTISDYLTSWYLAFTIDLDPNSANFSDVSKPTWPTYQSGSSGFSVMDVNYNMIGVIPDMDANPRCDFFRAQSYVVRN